MGRDDEDLSTRQKRERRDNEWHDLRFGERTLPGSNPPPVPTQSKIPSPEGSDSDSGFLAFAVIGSVLATALLYGAFGNSAIAGAAILGTLYLLYSNPRGKVYILFVGAGSLLTLPLFYSYGPLLLLVAATCICAWFGGGYVSRTSFWASMIAWTATISYLGLYTRTFATYAQANATVLLANWLLIPLAVQGGVAAIDLSFSKRIKAHFSKGHGLVDPAQIRARAALDKLRSDSTLAKGADVAQLDVLLRELEEVLGTLTRKKEDKVGLSLANELNTTLVSMAKAIYPSLGSDDQQKAHDTVNKANDLVKRKALELDLVLRE